MNKNRPFKFKILLVVIIVTIIVIALISYWFSTRNDEKKLSTNDYSATEALIYYNESTESYEIILGYLLDPHGNSIENANVSIEINGTTFYTSPDSNGLIKIIVSEELVSINDLNTLKTVIIKEEGVPDWIIYIELKYP